MGTGPTADIHPLLNENPFKLGVFSFNVKSGGAITTAEGSLRGTWDEQVAIAQAADRGGWDFVLPVARWRGMGGPSGYCDDSLETFTWAAGLAAVTERIGVICTVHVPIFHPLLAAKQGATIDVISGGRFGINVVVGWNASEFDMFGIEQQPHDVRYEVGAEWAAIVRALWSDESVDYEGKYYTIRDGYLSPKPVARPRPVLVNAGQSAAGIRFAAEHMDFTFQSHPEVDELLKLVTQAKQIARDEFDREIGVLSLLHIACADTEREAQDLFTYYVDEVGDDVAARRMVELMIGGDLRSVPRDVLAGHQRALKAGSGGMPIVGTPEMVTEKIIELHGLGLAGAAITWMDFQDGIGRFNEQVLPLMVEAGLRTA
jgi:dimethylsulfone monooxygenase